MEEKWRVAAEMGDWHEERLKLEEFGRSILRIFII